MSSKEDASVAVVVGEVEDVRTQFVQGISHYLVAVVVALVVESKVLLEELQQLLVFFVDLERHLLKGVRSGLVLAFLLDAFLVLLALVLRRERDSDEKAQ